MNRTLIAVLVFFFGTTLSVVDVRDWIAAEFPALASYLFLLKYLGAFFLGCLALVAIMELISWIIEAGARLAPSTLAYLALREAKAVDLPKIVELAQRQIGEQITQDSTEQIYNHNSRAIRKVVDTRDNRIVGYFCVLPLTNKGEEQVMERDLIGDAQDIGCFAKSFRKRTPVYIGSLAAEGLRARAATLELMKTYLVGKEVSKAYARPATRHGVRLVKRHDFKPVSEHDKIREGVYVIRVKDIA